VKGKKTTTKKKTSGAKTETKTISGLRNEQARIKQNIRKQEQALRANKAKVQQKLKDLERIGADMNRRQQSIDSINTDIKRINNDIGMLNSQLDNLTQQLNERKANYIKSMRYMAKQHGIHHEMMFIFSAKDLSQLYRRMRFVNEYASYQQTQGEAVISMQEQVKEAFHELSAAKRQKNDLLYRGEQERKSLENKSCWLRYSCKKRTINSVRKYFML
jgi:peptidoglycan hydrolase CwlO-like protein